MQLSTHRYGHVLNIYDNIIIFKVAKFKAEQNKQGKLRAGWRDKLKEILNIK